MRKEGLLFLLQLRNGVVGLADACRAGDEVVVRIGLIVIIHTGSQAKKREASQEEFQCFVHNLCSYASVCNEADEKPLEETMLELESDVEEGVKRIRIVVLRVL